jgi:hypothetical protein
MAVRRAKISPGPGQPLKDAVSVDVLESKEPWTEVHLDDGTVLRMKMVVAEVWRIENEHDQEGNPIYSIKAQAMMNTNAPDELKKKSH